MTNSSLDWQDCPLFAPAGAEIPKLDENEAKDVSPAIGALSHMLYDEETPEEKSELFRDEGNRHFKRGKRGYKHAIRKYDQAIEAAKDVPEALGPAFLNRAMAEFKLGNYGRSLKDAERSLELTPRNIKAHYRALLCATILEKYDIAMGHINQGLKLSGKGGKDTNIFQTQRKTIEAKIEMLQRQKEEREHRERKRQEASDTVTGMMKNRGMTLGAPLFAQQRRYTITKPNQEQGEWLWPLLLIYPDEVVECGLGDQSDYLEGVTEQVCMKDILQQVFEFRPDWDVNRRYTRAEDLEMRYRREWTRTRDEVDEESEEFCGSCLGKDDVGAWVTVNEDVTLGEVLRLEDYVIPMFPVLFVVPRGMKLR
ncbi:unnamed protein product [Agarophyton chilense]